MLMLAKNHDDLLYRRLRRKYEKCRFDKFEPAFLRFDIIIVLLCEGRRIILHGTENNKNMLLETGKNIQLEFSLDPNNVAESC